MSSQSALSAVLGVLVFAALAAAARGQEGALVEPFEWNDLLTTWRHVANEQVMFPLDMRDIPVRIGPHRQLFLDNYLIAEAKHVTREINRPTRFKGNPILVPIRRAGKVRRATNAVAPDHIMQFDTAPRFRMWYQSYRDWHEWTDGRQIRFATSYAVSDDGVRWRRPKLGLFDIPGSRLENIVLPCGPMQGVFYEPDEPDPQKRFKALVPVETRKKGQRTPAIPVGFYLYTSPDGIRWTGDLSSPVIPTPSGRGYVFPVVSIGDTTRFWRDPLRKKYVGDVKFVIPGKLRCRGTMESDDLIHWSRATPTFLGRRGDNQIYGHAGFAYQGMYVGMRWVYVPKRGRHHSSYVELDCSRDGRIWTRVGEGQPFMAFNPKRDTWDGGKMRPVAMLEVGDELWIYYLGKPTDVEMSNPSFPKSQRVENSVGLAKLPRDRFVSIRAGRDKGILLTRPLDFQGGALHVNADIAADGEIRVALVSRKGRVLRGYAAKACGPVKGNRLDIPVSWSGAPDLAKLRNSQVRLRFELRNAKLYSFRID